MKTYFNVPSMIPLTKKEAYALAKTRWNVHTEAQRQKNVGITWQAARGEVKYATWEELPAATKHCS